MSEETLEHILDTSTRYSCAICNVWIHGTHEGCGCSVLREEHFGLQGLCGSCANAYDRLMNDEGLKLVLKKFLHKEYWRAKGTVMDF